LIAAIDIEGDILFRLAEALRWPVLILTLLCLLATLVEFGGFIVEIARRRRRHFPLIAEGTREARLHLTINGDRQSAAWYLMPISRSVEMKGVLSRFVQEWGQPLGEENMSKALADFDFQSLKKLERTRLLVRAGPALGLMGTLIPLAPALAGLASGDVATLTENLRVAFSITVMGILIGAVAFGISLVRDRLYAQDLSDLEYVAGTLTSSGAVGYLEVQPAPEWKVA
jgi:biopolymer transport protein ExbB/TolQ